MLTEADAIPYVLSNQPRRVPWQVFNGDAGRWPAWERAQGNRAGPREQGALSATGGAIIFE